MSLSRKTTPPRPPTRRFCGVFWWLVVRCSLLFIFCCFFEAGGRWGGGGVGLECDSPIFLRRRVIPSSGQWSEVARTYQSAVLREHPWLQFFWPSQVPYPCTSWVVQDKGKRRADETSVERLTGDGGRTLRATLRKIKTPSSAGRAGGVGRR